MQVYCHIKPQKLKFKFGIDAAQLLNDMLNEAIEKARWNSSTSHKYRYREIN